MTRGIYKKFSVDEKAWVVKHAAECKVKGKKIVVRELHSRSKVRSSTIAG